MFQISILDNQNKKILGSMSLTASPSEYFSACLHMFVERLNGGAQLNEMAENYNMEGIPTKYHQQMAVTLWFEEFHRHPAFAAEKTLTPENKKL